MRGALGSATDATRSDAARRNRPETARDGGDGVVPRRAALQSHAHVRVVARREHRAEHEPLLVPLLHRVAHDVEEHDERQLARVPVAKTR